MSVNKSIGSRAQVMHGNANKTSGGLTKKHFKYNDNTCYALCTD